MKSDRNFNKLTHLLFMNLHARNKHYVTPVKFKSMERCAAKMIYDSIKAINSRITELGKDGSKQARIAFIRYSHSTHPKMYILDINSLKNMRKLISGRKYKGIAYKPPNNKKPKVV